MQRTNRPRRLGGRQAMLVLSGISFTIALVPALAAEQAAEGVPMWAYPTAPPGAKPSPDDGVPLKVPGSTASYTVPQVRDRFLAPDWRPSEGPMGFRDPIGPFFRKADPFTVGNGHRRESPQTSDIG